MRAWTAGVDFGGTNIKCGLVNRHGRVVRSVVLSTKRFSRPNGFVDGVSQTVESLAQSVGIKANRLCGVGVGAPGLVDSRRGTVHALVNVPGWRNVPLAQRLARRLRAPAFVDNDVNLVALGEWRFGAGRGAHHLACLTLGTGVGGGLVFDGRLYHGSSGTAGELGHMVINPGGRRCACGGRGCLEAQVGTAAILELARQSIRDGSATLRMLVRQAHGHLTPELIALAARRGDARARRIWIDIGRWLGIGLANLANLLNPDRIVIGGGVANAWRWFSPTLVSTVKSQAMDVPAQAVRIVRAQLGDQAGIVGAAVLVWTRTGQG